MILNALNGKPTRRQLLAIGGTLLVSELGLRRVSAQPTPLEPIRIGLVTPTRTGRMAVAASLYDFVGEAARRGALLAEEEIGTRINSLGMNLDILTASSPNADTAFRAGQRLVETEKVCALVGGLGEGQAQSLSQVARQHRIPFFNIGSPSEILREACNPYTFHVEASGAMYIDALVTWFAHLGHKRWYCVHLASNEGEALHRSARIAIDQHPADLKLVGSASVVPEQPVYFNELEAIRQANADVILLLLEAKDQIAFLAQQQEVQLNVAIAPFPDPVTQTRDYLSAVRYRAQADSAHRVQVWETTLENHGAATLNDRFTSRWGEPMDPPAWTAYQAVNILTEAIAATQTLESSVLIPYLESPQAVFNIRKGGGTSFRSWDHQLRQPLYVIEIDSQAKWGIELSQKLAIANLLQELPFSISQNRPRWEQLDQLGNSPGASKCRF